MNSEQIAGMRDAHRILAEFKFDPCKLERGYANRTLHIDISTNQIESRVVTQQMKDLWIGGKGFDLWLMFQEINKDTKWDSPENTVCFSSGPLGGVTSFPGSGKTIVTAISPMTHSIMDCNVGGYFGPYLKFSGFDALCITGKAREDVVVYIDSVNNKVTIETAPKESLDAHLLTEELTELYADNELGKRNVAVVCAGSAAEHIRMAVLNFSFYDWRRQVPRIKQAGRGGIGRVFRDKKIKAIVVRKEQVNPAWSISSSKQASHFEGSICHDCSGVDELEEVKRIIAQWNADPEFVIEMMQDVQERERYISEKSIEEITQITRVPKATLYHIATFYKAFSLAPRGETVIEVCMGTACHVLGAQNILEAFERELGIKSGYTTADKKFSLESVRCLGCCSIAPVVKIGDDVIGNVQAKDVPGIIAGKRGATSNHSTIAYTEGGEIHA